MRSVDLCAGVRCHVVGLEVPENELIVVLVPRKDLVGTPPFGQLIASKVVRYRPTPHSAVKRISSSFRRHLFSSGVGPISNKVPCQSEDCLGFWEGRRCVFFRFSWCANCDGRQNSNLGNIFSCEMRLASRRSEFIRGLKTTPRGGQIWDSPRGDVVTKARTPSQDVG